MQGCYCAHVALHRDKIYQTFLPSPSTHVEQQPSLVTCFPEESPVHLGWETVCSQALVSSQGIIHRNIGNT